jgi:peptide/nickel transport system substrate-binding protein
MEIKNKFKNRTTSLLVGVSMLALGSAAGALETLPKDKSMSGMEIELVGRDDLWTYQSCDSYNESPLTKSFVDAGKLPPVNERMPKDPWMAKKDQMVDGIGEYGGTFRHVIGGRPEGFNWLAVNGIFDKTWTTLASQG